MDRASKNIMIESWKTIQKGINSAAVERVKQQGTYEVKKFLWIQTKGFVRLSGSMRIVVTSETLKNHFYIFLINPRICLISELKNIS